MHTDCYRYAIDCVYNLGSEIRHFGNKLTDEEKEILIKELNRIISTLTVESVAAN